MHNSRHAMRWLFAVSLALSGCREGTTSSLDEKNLSPSEVLSDFDELSGTFTSLYGPMTYKERRFGINPTQLIAQTRAAIQASGDDATAFGLMKQFVAAFQDAHLDIEFPGNASGIQSYDLPVFVTPVAGHAIVAESSLGDGIGGGVNVGDELLTIDGQSPFDILKTILKYDSFATAASNQHYIAYTTSRPFYMKELIPTNPLATMVFAKPDGSHYQIVYPWVKTPVSAAPEFIPTKRAAAVDYTARKAQKLLKGAKGTLAELGARDPFFATTQATAAYNMSPVTVSSTYLTKYGLAAQPDIYAVTYQYQGKNVLLVRQPTYDVTDSDSAMNGYRAILDQEQSLVDVLVVDQTHNPGGDLDYAAQFFALFVNGTANAQVEHLHADRKWIYDLQQMATAISSPLPGASLADGTDTSTGTATGTGAGPSTGAGPNTGSSAAATTTSPAALAAYYQFMAQQVDAAIDANADVTTPFPLVGYQQMSGDSQVTWKKPVLVLADELAGSCGDIYPMLMQRNGIAKIFGATTMGAGGNVDDTIATLTNSQATLNLTRGVYTTYRPAGDYSDADLVENNGISPDIPYAHTVADFRAGYVGYVKAFSDQAVGLLGATTGGNPEVAATASH